MAIVDSMVQLEKNALLAETVELVKKSNSLTAWSSAMVELPSILEVHKRQNVAKFV